MEAKTFTVTNAKRIKRPVDIEFGKRLKEVLKKKRLTQREANALLGWSRLLMYYYTSGRKQIRIGRFAELVDKLSMTQGEVAYLLEPYWEDEDDVI